MRVIFLGSGGSRHMVCSQTRRTAGMLFELDKLRFVVDPGPGSLLTATQMGIQPERLNGVVLSHLHIDHATDANAYLDCITEPFVVAEQHCLLDKKQAKANFDYHPPVSVFHQAKSKLYPVKDKDNVSIGNVSFEAVKTDHYDPAVGFRIKCGSLDVGYVADGSYYSGLDKRFDGCSVLIANVIVPKGQETKPHHYLSVDGIILMLKNMSIKPKLLVLTHINQWMLRANLYKQEKIIQDATKVKTIHAEDSMELDLETLKFQQYKVPKVPV